jgi:hypothetical protein
MSEREGSQREWGARRPGRRAAPRGGAGMVPPPEAGIGMAPAGPAEERAPRERGTTMPVERA